MEVGLLAVKFLGIVSVASIVAIVLCVLAVLCYNTYIKFQDKNKKINTDKMLLSTGASDKNKVLNIFDFAGNAQEYTLEFSTSNSPCVIRGGNYGNDGNSIPVSTRNTRNTSKEFKYGNTTFRVCLY